MPSGHDPACQWHSRSGSASDGLAESAVQDDLTFLGIESGPSLVRTTDGNCCAERVIRTLKEQLLWVKTFATDE